MMITRENHEVHALDYIEGTLPPPAREAFEAFLRLHPREREELEGVAGTRLVPPRLVFEGKEALKRLDEGREDYLVIAAAEGVMTGEERARVEATGHGEAFEASVAALSRLRARPDLSTRFPGKRRLYRRRAWPRVVALAGGVAAAVLLAWLVPLVSPAPGEGAAVVGEEAAVEVEVAVAPPVVPAVTPARPARRVARVTREAPAGERVTWPVITALPGERLAPLTARVLPPGPPGVLHPRALPPAPVEEPVARVRFRAPRLPDREEVEEAIASLVYTGQDIVAGIERQVAVLLAR
jgi:hypothetical protein